MAEEGKKTCYPGNCLQQTGSDWLLVSQWELICSLVAERQVKWKHATEYLQKGVESEQYWPI